MPYFFMRSFEKALEPSRIAAFARGPKARRPAFSKASTAPAASGSSGATTVKSIFCSFANVTSLSNSITPMFTHSATSAMPALPGAQYSFSTFGLFASFHAMACSLPPPPTIKIFICMILLVLYIVVTVLLSSYTADRPDHKKPVCLVRLSIEFFRSRSGQWPAGAASILPPP